MAKALANGQEIDGLARMWETDADLDTLINDGDSRRGMSHLPSTSHPKSLLNSRRMFAKLREAFDQMDATATTGNPQLVDELDLFVTTTDLEGLAVSLQLGGGEVAEERRHRKAFRLRFAGPARNDFEAKDNPFLSFIARCTSSFPFAFEPMQFSQAQEAWWGTSSIKETSRWSKHFAEYGASAPGSPIVEDDRARPYGDGGYLDNKPFGYAIDTIALRGGGDTARVERKLVFIDPDPQRVLRRSLDRGEKPVVPNAIENTLVALRLPAYETIREDLLRLSDRNRIVDKIQSVIKGVTGDFGRLKADQRKVLAEELNARDQYRSRDLDDIVALFGAAYGGYHRLKVSRLTDELAELVANHMRISLESDEYWLVRFVVRAWRDAIYAPNPVWQVKQSGDESLAKKKTEFAFLDQMDLSYRVRRLAFVIEQINRLSGAAISELRETLASSHAFGAEATLFDQPDRVAELLSALDIRRRKLGVALRALREGRESLLGRQNEKILTDFDRHAKGIRTYIDSLPKRGGDRQRRMRAEELLLEKGGQGLAVLKELQADVANEVGRYAKEAREACAAVVPDIMRADGGVSNTSVIADLADNIVRHYYAWYELYDSMIFPISHGSEVGEEIAMVEPVRISPLGGMAAAGIGPGDERLLPAGIGIGHFGAFLDANWRANDILLGRLNAAEKLVRMMLTGVMDHDDQRVATYIRRAKAAIIDEELHRVGSLTSTWMAAIPNANTPEKILDHVAQSGMKRDPLPREKSLRWVTRSVRVSGKILNEASDGPATQALATAVTRAGKGLAAVAEVAMPNSWAGLLFRRWVARLWLYAAVLAVLGVVFGKPEMKSLGLLVLVVVSIYALATTILNGWIRGRPWLRWLLATLLLAVVGLAVVGGLDLWRSFDLTALWQKAIARLK